MGTLFITWRETLSYITRMGVGTNASVLVIGSGGNGLAFVSHARNLGARWITLVGSPRRAVEARLAGATDCVDYHSASCWDQVRSAAADGFDCVIDAVGKAAMSAQGAACLKPGGVIGIYGMDEGVQIAPGRDRAFRLYRGGYDEAEAHDAVLRDYRAGKLIPAVWTDRRQAFALDDIAQAFDAIMNRALVKPLILLKRADG